MHGEPHNNAHERRTPKATPAGAAERAEVARLAARFLADDHTKQHGQQYGLQHGLQHEQRLEAAVQRALHELRLPSDLRMPTILELRKHAQALEESRVGEHGRLQRIVEVLEEALEFLSALERAVVSFDPEGVDRRPPEVYGRAVHGELDLDPVVHMRVETSVRTHVLAGELAKLARGEVECRALSTRHGMIDELCVDTSLASYRMLRIPPRMGVDPDLSVTRGERVPHAGYEELSRRITQLQTR